MSASFRRRSRAAATSRAASTTISVCVHTSPSGCQPASCAQPTSSWSSGSSRGPKPPPAGGFRGTAPPPRLRLLPRRSSAPPSGDIASVVDAPRRVSSDARPTRPEWALTGSTPAARAAAWNLNPTICGDSGTTRSAGAGLDASRNVRTAPATSPSRTARSSGRGGPSPAPRRRRPSRRRPEEGAHLATPQPRHEEQPPRRADPADPLHRRLPRHLSDQEALPQRDDPERLVVVNVLVQVHPPRRAPRPSGRESAPSADPCRPSGSRCPPVGPTSTTRSATTAVRSPRARGSTELPPRGRSTLQSPAPAGGTRGPRIPGGTRGPKIPPAGGVSHPHTRHFRPIHASAPAGGILGPTHPPATPSRSAPQVGLLPRLHRPNPRIRGRRQVRGPWPGPPPRRGAPGRGRGRRRSDGSPPAPGRAVRSPAGCCSPARRAPEARRGHRRRCAQGRSSLLVELGEVAGQGRVLKRPAREPSVEAAERSGVTPGGCSG